MNPIFPTRRLRTTALCLICLAAFGVRPVRAVEPVRFSRDVLPILADHCFHCHGPDEGKRKGDLRLDTREGALAAISVDEPTDSEFLRPAQGTYGPADSNAGAVDRRGCGLGSALGV
ncbi:MAG: hypothetical protein NT069_30610 [Planctomycetota bacterium]|nr:hypothetical protein [Planctomycetota bacterium]